MHSIYYYIVFLYGIFDNPISGNAAAPEPEGFYYNPEYHLPHHLRHVIPGLDIDYYDFLIIQQQQEEEEIKGIAPPSERGGILPNEDDDEEFVPVKDDPEIKGRFIMCYAEDIEDVTARCKKATKYGTGVYIPMVKMESFNRHENMEIENPAKQKVSISPEYYRQNRSLYPKEWFDAIRKLKSKTNLQVAGVWFGAPDFILMDKITREHKDLFDGILVDWAHGVGACPNKLPYPPKFNRRGLATAWNDPKFFLRYYMGHQDDKTCKLSNGEHYTQDRYVYDRREINLPFGWTPVFPCFGGNEGLCYKAFTRHPKDVCGTKQRYMFSPFERESESMREYFRDICRGVEVETPPYDTAMTI